MVSIRSGICLFFVISYCFLPGFASAQTRTRCNNPIGVLVSAAGTIEIRSDSSKDWIRADMHDPVCPGDEIRADNLSGATIRLHGNGEIIRLAEISQIQITEAGWGIRLIKIIKGAIYGSWDNLRRTVSGAATRLEINAPYVNGKVTGTEFYVRVYEDHTLFTVFEGRVQLSNEHGSLLLSGNQSAVTRAGQAPQIQIPVQPRNAVQWMIYYPPVLSPWSDSLSPDTPHSSLYRQSLEALLSNDPAMGYNLIQQIPEADRDAKFYTYRAGMRLAAGDLEEARKDLDRTLSLSPDNSDAYSLLAVIAVAQNNTEQALQYGRRAVDLNPDSSAARIALSYGLQSNMELVEARAILLQAVDVLPDDALAWARLAEIQLSLGYLDKAIEAAQTAVAKKPDLGYAHMVLGFARLSQIKVVQAFASFEKALSLDPKIPMAFLGLGLARIRKGDLEEGRRDIAIAVVLDPNNSLVHSYLGKAYFEEKHDTLAAEQLARAKRLDPLDPTPYFYDAIRKQTMNRPAEALSDLQKAIERNDNRAVYRSRLLLDEDLAARSASLGRIYRDLGFEQLAVVEGWKSVMADPGNYSGHRFLADTYSVLPRHGRARASELLQSQLLQPANIRPIQPTLAETSLFLWPGSGPADPAFNEFTPLFNRNGFALQGSGIVGTNKTWGDEIAHSGLWNSFSYSIGQFHYESDGFRENNDQNIDIYNLFLQANLSHKTGIQGEFRYSNSTKGDLDLRFNPESYSTNLRQREGLGTLRFGLHHAFTPNSEIIASVIYGRLDSLANNSYTNEFMLPAAYEIFVYDKGWTTEVQHIYRSEYFRLISGLGYFEADREDKVYSMNSFPFPPFSMENYEGDSKTAKHTNAYVYSLFDCLETLTLTVGASGDFTNDGTSILNQFNPKLGIKWDLTPSTTVRAAGFRTIHRALVSDQTIEPTNIAGFNQVFSDYEGVSAWRYGTGLDQKISSHYYAGAEITWRDLTVPATVIPPEPAPFELAQIRADWEEDMVRGYFFGIPHQSVALSAEYLYERFRRYDGVFGPENIARLNTHRIPVGIRYFHSSGLSAHLRVSYINQSGEFPVSTGPRIDDYDLTPDDSQFGVLDLGFGYRFPRRYGIAHFEVRNLFDNKSSFQNMDPARPEISPERFISLRFTISF